MNFPTKEHIKDQIKYHQDILIFMCIIVCFHAFWKLGREADASDEIIHFYGKDFSAFFTSICMFLTDIVYKITYFIKGDALERVFCNLHYSDTNTGIRIVWGCSGVKEILMTTLVILASKGNIYKKMWYIPLGIIFISLLNLIRLITLTLMVHQHAEYFDFVHGIVFRGVIYLGIFSVWLLWTERIKRTN